MDNTRFKLLTLDEMTPEQRQVAERNLSGPRKKIGPPWKTLLHSAGIAEPVERLGEYVRFGTSIPQRLSELVILVMARHWTVQYPWSVHCGPAIECGVSPEVVEQLARGQRPTGMKPDEELIYDFCKGLLDGNGVSDDLFAAMKKAYGDKGLVDLFGLMGYYFMLSLALTTDRYPPVPGDFPPLKPL